MPEFAKRLEYMEQTAEVLRGLFGAMSDPSIISFGGGAPASVALPVEQLHEIADEVLRREGRGVEALQYGPVPGVRQLREIVAERLLKPNGVDADHTSLPSRPWWLSSSACWWRRYSTCSRRPPTWRATPPR